MRARLARATIVAGVVTLLAGCVNYPKITDIGGTNIRPENARLVRETDGASLYVNLHSTGKFGDVITAARTTVARDAALVNGAGATVPRIEIPGITVFAFRPGGPHVRLANLTRPLVPGESVIVTLTFAKIGNLGIVSVVE